MEIQTSYHKVFFINKVACIQATYLLMTQHYFNYSNFIQELGHMSVITLFRRMRQEESWQFQTSMSNIVP